jgi:hypothetical protein
MTDTSPLNLPNTTALSSDLMYNIKPSAARSRNYRASILPTNKNNFKPNDTCIVYIPGGRRGTYLDTKQSYYRMTVKNPDTVNAINLDGTGACIINRVDIFHGSNLIETIQGYNILANYIFDMQTNVANRMSLSNIYGFSSDGERSGIVIAAGQSITLCMPFISGVIGSTIDKMVPLGILADDIRIEMVFESAIIGVVTSSTGASLGFEVIDMQLELTIVELSDEGESMVRSVAPVNEPIYIHGSSFRHFSNSMNANTSGQYSCLVPARFCSLKSIAMIPLRSTEYMDGASYSTGSRINPCIDSYFFRVGSQIIPNRPVTLFNNNNTGGYGEGYAELLKSWHGLHTYAYVSSISSTEYNRNDSAITGTKIAAPSTTRNSWNNGFVIAQELESMSHKSDIILSGMNTLSSQLFFEATINQTGPSVPYNLNFFACFDHIIVIQDGIMSVKM